MKILALEFSSPQRSVAVVRAERDQSSVVYEVVESGPGSTRPLSMVKEALREAKLEREEIECLAVGLGPGSYTGIRAAIALAQGWKLVRDIKLAGISSADALAAQAQMEGLPDPVGVVIDAQRNELYFASYKVSKQGLKEVEPLKILSLAEVKARAKNDITLVGPEVTRWFAGGKDLLPRAANLARLALERNDFVAGENLTPIYLRETQFVKAPKPRVLP